jgi:hypothetical protein
MFYGVAGLPRAVAESGAGTFSNLRSGASVMAPKKAGHATPWTNQDEHQLKAYSEARTPVIEIAKKMKRTEAAVRQKASHLGISLGHRRPRS